MLSSYVFKIFYLLFQGPMVPLVVSPGYILSKNKSKYDAVIKTDEFFNPVHEETVK